MKETFETRDIARELARKYSTMTHEELDTLESILVPMKFAKGEMILKEGEVCENIYYIEHGLVRQFYFKNGKQITEHFWQEIVKFYKFKPHLNFSYQILLPHKTKAVKSFAKKHFKAIKTTHIFTNLLNLTSY